MSTLTVTAKGQVTLRKDILEHLGVAPGAQVHVEKLPDGRIEIRGAPAEDISAVFGMVKPKSGRGMSIDSMNEIARQGWARKGVKKA